MLRYLKVRYILVLQFHEASIQRCTVLYQSVGVTSHYLWVKSLDYLAFSLGFLSYHQFNDKPSISCWFVFVDVTQVHPSIDLMGLLQDS